MSADFIQTVVAQIRVDTTLRTLFKVEIKKFKELSCDLINAADGSTITQFQVKLYSTENSPGVAWFQDASEWENLPDIGVIRAVARGVNPATLLPGASTAFRIEEISSFFAVEFLAAAAGPTTLDLYVGRGIGEGR